MFMKELRTKEVIEWIKNSDKICVIFHIDTDGITSAYLFTRLVEKLGKNVERFYASPASSFNKKLYDKVKDYDLVVFLDLSIDHNTKYINLLSEGSRVVIIDHHTLRQDLNSDRIIHISTKFLTDKYYPNAYFVYNLFRDYLKEYDWIAAIGLIGDGGARFYPDFMRSVLKRLGMEEGKDENFQDTKLGYYDILLGSARMYSGGRGALKALKILLECNSPEEFEDNSSILKTWHKKVRRELEAKINVFRRNARKVGKLMYYHFSKPIYNIGSPLSTILCKEFPHNLIVITVDVNQTTTKVHAKSHTGEFNTYEILEKCVPNLKGATFGGHVQASGGSFDSKELKKFEECLFTIAKNLKPKEIKES